MFITLIAFVGKQIYKQTDKCSNISQNNQVIINLFTFQLNMTFQYNVEYLSPLGALPLQPHPPNQSIRCRD